MIINTAKPAKVISKQDIADHVMGLYKLLKTTPKKDTVLDFIECWKKRFEKAPFNEPDDEAKKPKPIRNRRKLAVSRLSNITTS